MHRLAYRLVQLDPIIGMALNPVPLKHFTHILHVTLWFSLSLSVLTADIACKQRVLSRCLLNPCQLVRLTSMEVPWQLHVASLSNPQVAMAIASTR